MGKRPFWMHGLLLASLSLGPGSFAYAETGTATGVVQSQSPEAIAESALNAVQEYRLADYARMFHPDELTKFRTTMLAIAKAAAKQGQEQQFLTFFTQTETVDALESLDDITFFAQFMEGIFNQVPQFKSILSNSQKPEILGHVTEGQDTVHVVYRSYASTGDLSITKMSVLSLKSQDGEWRLLLTGDIEGITRALERGFKR